MKRATKSQGDPKTADAGAGEAVDTEASVGVAAGSVPNDPSFEACSERLQEIVNALEDGDLPLERSLELFEEGVRLARHAKRRLDTAERRVEELLGTDTAGEPVTKEL